MTQTPLWFSRAWTARGTGFSQEKTGGLCTAAMTSHETQPSPRTAELTSYPSQGSLHLPFSFPSRCSVILVEAPTVR